MRSRPPCCARRPSSAAASFIMGRMALVSTSAACPRPSAVRQHGEEVRVHERLAAREADGAHRQPVLGDFIEVGRDIRRGEVGQPVVAGGAFDVAVAAREVAQRARVEPQRIERPQRHLRARLPLGGQGGILELGGIERRKGLQHGASSTTDGAACVIPLSVVIPALNAARTLPGTIASLGPVAEIVVVDGGSVDGTAALARAAGARVVRTGRGRGGQIAAGIAAARHDGLLILHADTRLAPGWAAAAAAHLAARPDHAAHFRFRLDSADPRARRLERAVAWRCRVLGPCRMAIRACCCPARCWSGPGACGRGR